MTQPTRRPHWKNRCLRPHGAGDGSSTSAETLFARPTRRPAVAPAAGDYLRRTLVTLTGGVVLGMPEQSRSRLLTGCPRSTWR